MARQRSIKDIDTPVTIWGAIRENERSAVRTFCDLYGPVIRTLAQRRGLDDHAADDVMQTVLVAMLDAIQHKQLQKEPAKGRFRDYLAKAAAHEVAHVRHKSRGASRGRNERTEVNALDDAALPLDELIGEERAERFRLILDRLRVDGPGGRKAATWSRRFAAFQEYALQEKPADKVAKKYKLTRDQIYRDKHRILEQVRRLWLELDAEFGEV